MPVHTAQYGIFSDGITCGGVSAGGEAGADSGALNRRPHAPQAVNSSGQAYGFACSQ
jgi:hypothetical protein